MWIQHNKLTHLQRKFVYMIHFKYQTTSFLGEEYQLPGVQSFIKRYKLPCVLSFIMRYSFFGIEPISLFPFFLQMTKLSTHQVLGQAGIYRVKKSIILKMLIWICHPNTKEAKTTPLKNTID